MAYSDEQIKHVVRELAENKNPAIQEAEFISKFLPMFSADPRRTDGTIFVNAWINVANSPFAEVDVMRGNELLFTIPPILYAPKNLLDALGGSNAYRNITDAALKYNVMPKLGEAAMQRWMKETVPNQDISYSHLLRWNEIFKRYNLPLYPVPNEKVADVTKTEKEVTIGDFDYEDL